MEAINAGLLAIAVDNNNPIAPDCSNSNGLVDFSTVSLGNLAVGDKNGNNAVMLNQQEEFAEQKEATEDFDPPTVQRIKPSVSYLAPLNKSNNFTNPSFYDLMVTSCFRPFNNWFGQSRTDSCLTSDSDTENYEISLESIDVNFKENYIGGGNQSSVFRGRLNGRYIALKKLNRASEVDIKKLMGLDHPNVIKTLGICTKDIYPCIIMEYCEKGGLFDVLRRVQVTKALFLKWSREIAEGMQYLHALKIVHRDLKSPNILVDDNNRLKICDFGSVYAWEKTQMPSVVMSVCGTSQWMCPEMMKNEPCNEKVDVWSFGVVLWEILTQEVPYRNISPMAIMYGVGSGQLHLHVPKSAPDSIKLLLKLCWAKRPRNRPSFTSSLNHLENLRVEIAEISEEAWTIRREVWRKEITDENDKLSVHNSTNANEQKAEELVRKRMHEFRHAQEIRFMYEEKMKRVNRMMKTLFNFLEEVRLREQELVERERHLMDALNKRTFTEPLVSRRHRHQHRHHHHHQRNQKGIKQKSSDSPKSLTKGLRNGSANGPRKSRLNSTNVQKTLLVQASSFGSGDDLSSGRTVDNVTFPCGTTSGRHAVLRLSVVDDDNVRSDISNNNDNGGVVVSRLMVKDDDIINNNDCQPHSLANNVDDVCQLASSSDEDDDVESESSSSNSRSSCSSLGDKEQSVKQQQSVKRSFKHQLKSKSHGSHNNDGSNSCCCHNSHRVDNLFHRQQQLSAAFDIDGRPTVDDAFHNAACRCSHRQHCLSDRSRMRNASDCNFLCRCGSSNTVGHSLQQHYNHPQKPSIGSSPTGIGSVDTMMSREGSIIGCGGSASNFAGMTHLTSADSVACTHCTSSAQQQEFFNRNSFARISNISADSGFCHFDEFGSAAASNGNNSTFSFCHTGSFRLNFGEVESRIDLDRSGELSATSVVGACGCCRLQQGHYFKSTTTHSRAQLYRNVEGRWSDGRIQQKVNPPSVRGSNGRLVMLPRPASYTAPVMPQPPATDAYLGSVIDNKRMAVATECECHRCLLPTQCRGGMPTRCNSKASNVKCRRATSEIPQSLISAALPVEEMDSGQQRTNVNQGLAFDERLVDAEPISPKEYSVDVDDLSNAASRQKRVASTSSSPKLPPYDKCGDIGNACDYFVDEAPLDVVKLVTTSIPSESVNSTHLVSIKSFAFSSSNKHEKGNAPQSPCNHHVTKADDSSSLANRCFSSVALSDEFRRRTHSMQLSPSSSPKSNAAISQRQRRSKMALNDCAANRSRRIAAAAEVDETDDENTAPAQPASFRRATAATLLETSSSTSATMVSSLERSLEIAAITHDDLSDKESRLREAKTTFKTHKRTASNPLYFPPRHYPPTKAVFLQQLLSSSDGSRSQQMSVVPTGSSNGRSADRERDNDPVYC